MLPIQKETFYKFYLHNHFRIRAVTLDVLLRNPDQYASLFEPITNITQNEIFNSLKLEIRGTYFHSIETLYQLLFALDKDGYDENIWHNLTKGEYHYPDINLIAENEGMNSILDSTIKLKNGADSVKEISFINYAFYFAPNADYENEEMKKNHEFIRKFLVLIAKEFSDRSDYNAYKHGLRLFPTMKNIHAWNSDNTASLFLSYENSYTILDKKDEYTHRIINFDPQRDIKMTCLCSELISNLILTRKSAHSLEKETSVYYYFDEDFDKYTTPNIQSKGMTFSVKPIYDEAEPSKEQQ